MRTYKRMVEYAGKRLAGWLATEDGRDCAALIVIAVLGLHVAVVYVNHFK